MSVECTREACLARSIDEVDGGCAASPVCKPGRFRTSLRANGEYTDDAEVLRPTPPDPPFTRGGKVIAIARMYATTTLLPELDDTQQRKHPAPDRPPGPITIKLSPASRKLLTLGVLKAGQTYTLLVTLESGRLEPDDRLTVELSGAGTDRFVKELHAGDPDLYLPYRPARDGQGHVDAREKAEHRRFVLTRSRRVERI